MEYYHYYFAPALPMVVVAVVVKAADTRSRTLILLPAVPEMEYPRCVIIRPIPSIRVHLSISSIQVAAMPEWWKVEREE